MPPPKSPVREALTKMFLDALYQEQLPWEAGWNNRPYNCASNKKYKGVNRLYLSQVAEEKGWQDPRWCTYKQAQDNGWQVRKGEKSSRVEYWAYYDKAQKKLLSWSDVRTLLALDPQYEKNLLLNCRTYSVFNAAQIDGIPELVQSHLDIGNLRQQRDTLLRNMDVGYKEQGDRAYYSPVHDRITLPPEHTFTDTYNYMATFLHEAGHASGHPARLARDLSGSYGSTSYAKEELRAEIASAFVAQELGIHTTAASRKQHLQSHAAYIQSWISCLEKDPDELMRAVNDAEKISDYLIEKGDFFPGQTLDPLSPATHINGPGQLEEQPDNASPDRQKSASPFDHYMTDKMRFSHEENHPRQTDRMDSHGKTGGQSAQKRSLDRSKNELVL